MNDSNLSLPQHEFHAHCDLDGGLICGTGQLAVITGCTDHTAIAEQLAPHEYAVIGQLKSPEKDISPWIRNLIANPHVRFLVIFNTAEDNLTNGSRCLLDFFYHGFERGTTADGEDCWRIHSRFHSRSCIDIAITSAALTQLRHSVSMQESPNPETAIAYVKAVARGLQIVRCSPWSHPQFF